ncbi:MAG: substrate-binding domain-containing protein [Planctomycetota bacterium]
MTSPTHRRRPGCPQRSITRRSVGVFALASLLTLAACGGGGAGAAGGAKTLRVAVIPKGTTHEFWKSVHAGAERAARELDVEVLWKGPQKEDDREAQIRVVEDFVVKGVDAIVLMPLDKTALGRPAREAAAAGIPVVIADSDLMWDGRTSFVATDNHRGGELAGEHLASLLGGQGKVVLLRYLEGSASTEEREAGFLAAIAKHPGLEVISQNQHAGATKESALAAAENLLNAHAAIDGVFCPNESAAYSMMRALQDSGRKAKVKFVGFDSSEGLLQGLRDGHVDALVLQDPVRMGELAVRAAVAAARGEKVEPRIDTGVTIATPANIDAPEILALLAPDLSILGG